MRSVLAAMREIERDSSSEASSAPSTASPTATAAARAARSSSTCESAESSTIGTAAATDNAGPGSAASDAPAADSRARRSSTSRSTRSPLATAWVTARRIGGAHRRPRPAGSPSLEPAGFRLHEDVAGVARHHDDRVGGDPVLADQRESVSSVKSKPITPPRRAARRPNAGDVGQGEAIGLGQYRRVARSRRRTMGACADRSRMAVRVGVRLPSGI